MNKFESGLKWSEEGSPDTSFFDQTVKELLVEEERRRVEKD